MDEQLYTDLLDFWFARRELDQPTLDSRMNSWFGSDPTFDAEVAERFCALAERALAGDCEAWSATPRGRLALILLLSEIPRHIYKHSQQAYRGDRRALKLCEQGVANKDHQRLDALEQLFFFMPLQRMESLKVQQTSVKVFAALAQRVSDTLRESFAMVAHLAELRRDIIAEFGRFPHRNEMLGRETADSEKTLASA
jgi:uncharacterized protein (DUF924 family)